MWINNPGELNDCPSDNSIFDQLSVGICQLDRNGNILKANRKMIEILDAQQINTTLNINNYLPLPFIRIEEMMDGQERNVAIIKEGRISREVLVSFRPLKNTSEEKYQTLATFIDLTSSRTSQTENIYREIFHKSSRAQAISQNFHFTEVNDAYAGMYGYTREELIGTPVFRMLTEKSIEEVRILKERKDRGEHIPQFYQIEGRKKDGTVFPAEVELNFLSLSGGESVFFSVKDITREKQAKEALIASEAKFRSVFRSSMIGITFSNKHHEIVEVNDQFLKTVGYTREDFTQKTFSWQTLTPPEFYETDMKAVQEFHISGNIPPYEKELIRKDGSRIPVLVAASSIDSNSVGVGFMIDLSEIKSFKRETEKLTRELSTYIYMASHDLKGPLASVIGLTAVARTEIEDQKALEYIELIRRSTLKLDKSLINLMKIMKIKNNQIDLNPIDFINIIEEVLSDLKYSEDFSRCKINKVVSLQRPFFSDYELIKSVFQNLIENSVKYQNQFKIPVIEISVWEEENKVFLRVSDNGKGIDEKIKDRIFEMFFRGTLESKGSGLGLYIVKSAAEQLNGKIEVSNKITGGCEFTISLPKVFDMENA
jgi:PAS domain S-box-containing protein